MPEVLTYLPLIASGVVIVSAFVVVKVSLDNLKSRIVDGNGRLNVVDAKSCKEYREGMTKLHEVNKDDHKEIMAIITRLSRNVDRILFKMEIEPNPHDED